MLKNDKSIIRIFYPVGQGAFYREAFYRNGENVFNIVYDCGSKTDYGNKKIQESIDNWIGKKEIDILFISHFHEDHTSGIRYWEGKCTIKNVIVPYLNQKNKNIIKICYLVNADINIKKERIDNFFDIIDNFDSIFDKETNIYYIKADNFNEKEYVENEKKESIYNSGDITNILKNRIKVNDYWKFITYVIENKVSDQVINEIEKILKKGIGSVDNEILINNLANIDNRKQIREKLKEHNNNHDINNELSLTLYSGPIEESYGIMINYCNIEQAKINEAIGSMYFGDFNAKKNLNELIEFYEEHDINFNKVGILQLPHHGSKGSFNEDLICKFTNCIYVASAGINNEYKHPSKKVVEKISNDNRTLFVVTEYMNPLIFVLINNISDEQETIETE